MRRLWVGLVLGRYLGLRCFVGSTGYTCAVSHDAHDFVFRFVAGVMRAEAKADECVSVCMYISTSSCHRVKWRAQRDSSAYARPYCARLNAQPEVCCLTGYSTLQNIKREKKLQQSRKRKRRMADNGVFVLCFTSVTYFVQRGEWTRKGNDRIRRNAGGKAEKRTRDCRCRYP